ncbi:pyridoxal phosphate-dependent aminotransferase [Kibdelosporangium aridum]|uniref:Aminotransferase n=2 Tax=Pseudonocardiaceae TaxID=2070 RepID=A0A428YQU4_KIBAR|nr:pyridoxal phosphate-dependent aminotransferase [Kibdelosporangium aridum]RSM70814.1 pyridoxal phosphate-dependent aminotransferase [Kibdelosporangium aridum]CAB45026.1 putative aminotransferase [Amycolatopsis orientalis]
MNRVLSALAPHSSKRISEYAQRHPGTVDLTVGLPAFGPPRSFDERLAMLSSAPHVNARPEDQYAHSRGAIELRAAIAHVYKSEQGVDLDPDTQILVTNGAAGALWIAVLTLTEPGDEVLLADPGYMIYPPMIELLGRRVVRIPTSPADGFRLHLSDLRSRLTQRSRVVLVNSPGNPTGRVSSEDELADLCAFAVEHGLYVVHDEVLDRFAYGIEHRSVVALDHQGVGIAVNGLSKRFGMSGWRIGWLASSSAVIAEAAKAHTFFMLAVSHAVQLAAAAALSDPKADGEVSVYAAEIRRRGEVFLADLARIPGLGKTTVPDGGFYAFVDVGEFARLRGIRVAESTSAAVAEYLLHECGVAVVPGSVFGRAGEGFVRMSFAGSAEQLDRAVKRLAG